MSSPRPPDRVARVRTPRPLLAHRLPSGRGATEQPNASNDVAPLTPAFWAAVVVTGVATGVLGIAMLALLHGVQALAFGKGDLLEAVQRASPLRRVLVLTVAGAVVGPAWFLLRRATRGQNSDLDDAVWTGSGQLSFRRCLGTAALSEVAVGAGASVGQEAAPKLLGGAAGSLLASWRGLAPSQRRLLVACGGGAGMGAVYNVPLGGALITAELLYGSLSLPVILPALACSWIATAVAWAYLGTAATYPGVPTYPARPSLVVFALLAGPVVGLVAVGWIRLLGWVSHYQLRGRWVLVAPTVALGVLGLVATAYPQLLGNGKDLAARAFLADGRQAIGLLVVLALLKPLATAWVLGSGVTGGLFTPTMSTGAVLGVLFGQLWSAAVPGTPIGAFAVVCAAAMIGAAMQTPLAALALMVELTGTADTLIVPMIAATTLATLVARYLDGYSIYSSRLPAHQTPAHQDGGERL